MVAPETCCDRQQQYQQVEARKQAYPPINDTRLAQSGPFIIIKPKRLSVVLTFAVQHMVQHRPTCQSLHFTAAIGVGQFVIGQISMVYRCVEQPDKYTHVWFEQIHWIKPPHQAIGLDRTGQAKVIVPYIKLNVFRKSLIFHRATHLQRYNGAMQ